MRACYRSILFISVFCYTLCGQAASAADEPPPPANTNTPAVTPAVTAAAAPAVNGCQSNEVYMPDGQIASHSIRVYVPRNILLSQNPTLRLLRSHAVTKKDVQDAKPELPGVVAPGQTWKESMDGQEVACSGTLLMFGLSDMDFQFKPMVRVLPVLRWTEGGAQQTAVGAREVNVGNILFAFVWTLIVVGAALVIILPLSRIGKTNPVLLLSGVDGHLSLSQAQIACWTIVVGGVVLGYGLIKLDIPQIPTSLLALMGASLATGGIGFFQDSQKQQAAAKAGVGSMRRDLSLGDLVRNFPVGQDPELSLAKAQMIFWTVLLVVLFIGKSILDGVIWDVPWPLVALMGFSQAGYLAPKLTPQPPPTPATTDATAAKTDAATAATADAAAAAKTDATTAVTADVRQQPPPESAAAQEP